MAKFPDAENPEQPECKGSDAIVNDEVISTVLDWAPGAMKQGKQTFRNLTPWVNKVFCMHSYYMYVYFFYMFVLAFYKGYALDYPKGRRWTELLLIFTIPFLQHLRFFFGHWCVELGMQNDVCIFLFLTAVVLQVLMYFIFRQAYILPLDSTLLTSAALMVCCEGVCGVINALHAFKQSSGCQKFMLAASTMLFFGMGCEFLVAELLPEVS